MSRRTGVSLRACNLGAPRASLDPWRLSRERITRRSSMTPRMRSGAMDCGGSLQQGKRPRMVCGSRPSSWRLQTSTFAGGCCRRKFQLHLCIGPSRDCTKTKRKPSFEFHTDFFRLLDTGDLCGKVLPWTKLEPAKRDLEDELAKLQGEAQGQTGLGWTASDDDEDDGEEADVSEVKKMLAALKASVAKGDPGGGAGGDARNKSEEGPQEKEKGQEPQRAQIAKEETGKVRVIGLCAPAVVWPAEAE